MSQKSQRNHKKFKFQNIIKIYKKIKISPKQKLATQTHVRNMNTKHTYMYIHYNNTKCAVKINNKTTNFFNYEQGVQPGNPQVHYYLTCI